MAEDRLKDLRSELDVINLELLQLLSKRADVVQRIGHLKQTRGVAIFDPEREKQQLDRLVEENPGPFPDSTIRHLFKQIFQASQGLQEEQRKLLVSRQRNHEDTVVTVRGIKIGGGVPIVVGGPCSVETDDQMEKIGQEMQVQGIQLVRGGAFKPRTSPYDFQGLGEKGLRMLRDTARKYGFATVSEIVNPADVEMAIQYVDMIQVGARNMQNFELLKAVGNTRVPVLLKRGLSATIEELIYAAEYIAARGNEQIVLCERGIRTYEKATRNTLDISAVPILKQETHLPVLVDVTHSTGRKDIMLPVAKAALAVGADGIMVEVHPEPQVALSDAKQQLNFAEFDHFMESLRSSGMIPALVTTHG
ncbi:bifunctional 3-deoxy-7-phosphoheptulonate synthase/chorismate mutase [Ferroacidibacillus organovorans]|uniref:Chorismate mutase n=1 Tax=Ferroacidibacillus organovorans TaxID=1765683 RepID=A0A162TUL4_9BACL|nr:bifunctional 3-deoxy-7-phosphoheptulonate synthase/chorismate mutase [Ferroacidibacillus organovorans]KYP81148.1 chorismate mutase [Ferroacidibacillus organovorans]OAG87899.1 chorismate mutase [Ferroacidibacillus organovorans]OPG16350.1 chorismate mutase [Ferroacidibacillus organovorans]